MKEKLIIEISLLHYLAICIHFMMKTEGLGKYYLLAPSFYNSNSNVKLGHCECYKLSQSSINLLWTSLI